MKYITQVLIIVLFTFLGEVLSYVIPFPIPAAIYGIVLMLIALGTGILKPEKVRDVSQFLISIMPVLFVAPAVRILEYWGIIAPNVAAIATIAVVSTFLVFAVSALVVNALLKKNRKEDQSNG